MEPTSFRIKQPRWLLILSVLVGVVAFIVATPTVVLCVQQKMDIETGASLWVLSFFFAFLASVGLYAYCTDIFIYENGTFVCKRIFLRKKTVSASVVAEVQESVFHGGSIIFLLDEEGKLLMRVTDAVPIVADYRFREVLDYYHIALTETKRVF